MQVTYIAMVEHSQGKQITRIEARCEADATRRLKAKGYEVIWVALDSDE